MYLQLSIASILIIKRSLQRVICNTSHSFLFFFFNVSFSPFTLRWTSDFTERLGSAIFTEAMRVTCHCVRAVTRRLVRNSCHSSKAIYLVGYWCYHRILIFHQAFRLEACRLQRRPSSIRFTAVQATHAAQFSL